MSDIVTELNRYAKLTDLEASDIMEEAADEILRLSAENAKVRSLLRWDIVEDEEGLIICDGDHEKGEKCDHRRLYWQSTVDALRAENEKLRHMLDAETEQARKDVVYFDELRVENERLQAKCEFICDELLEAKGQVEKLRAALSELVGAASRVNMRTGTEFYTAWRAAYDITKGATIEDYSTVRAAALKETGDD